MDSHKFDSVVRQLSQSRSRRSLVSGAIGVTLASLSVLGNATIAKKKKTQKGSRAKSGGGYTPAPQGGGQSSGKKGQPKETICHCENGDPALCTTISVAKPGAKNHLKNHCDYENACRPEVVNPCYPESSLLPVIGTEGDVARIDDFQFTATTEGEAGYGNLVFGIPVETTFSRLGVMETQFEFLTETTCSGGSPRFVVYLKNGRCPYAVFPTPCNAKGGTPNLIGTTANDVWIDNLCGGTAQSSTYESVLADYGNELIDRILLVVDESPTPGVSERTVTLKPRIELADLI